MSESLSYLIAEGQIRRSLEKAMRIILLYDDMFYAKKEARFVCSLSTCMEREHTVVHGKNILNKKNNCPDKGGRNQKESKEMLRNMADLTGRGYI